MALFPLNGGDQEILAVRLLCSIIRTSRGGSGGSKIKFIHSTDLKI